MKPIHFFFLMLACMASHLHADNHEAGKNSVKRNILWIFVEDLSPWMESYGHPVNAGKTPALDRLSENGVRFTRCFVPAPVCSACRSAIITGVYQTTTGTHQHRSSRTKESAIHLPKGIKTLPQIFREHGYATFNKGKDDYNFVYDRKEIYSIGNPKPPKGGKKARGNFYGKNGRGDWTSIPKGKPWFGQIQLHGGKANTRRLKDKVDPATMKVPPYFPNEEMFRKEWAHHYDTVRITDMDVQNIMKRLKDDGLLDNTIVFFFSDHGNNHSLRHKQFCYEGGVHVPLIITGPGIPKKAVRKELMSALDISATTLALAGIKLPDYLDGQDLFSNDYKARDHIISARDRCDYTIDRIRTVRTENMRYIRNFKTDRILLQPQYRDGQAPTKRLRALHASGELGAVPERAFFGKRPAEELYDLTKDPHQIHNLANDPKYADALKQHRQLLNDWIKKTDDKGQYPESEKNLRAIYKRWGKRCVNPEFDVFKKKALSDESSSSALNTKEKKPSRVALAKGVALKRPNILWLTAEDHGPHLGCYGDDYATTPHLDALASRSLRYTHASSTAPICAPARTTIITGMYPPSLGAQHMRSRVHVPKWLKLLPELMRAGGYYCTNNSKQDYNLILGRNVWDASSNKAHWKNRPKGKPFFAVFNTAASHESRIRNANPHPKHDPAKAPVPPYHPDTPEVRKDWAQYYDRLTEVDRFVKKHLDDLKKAGLEDDTIVVFFADHGSGMPRHKRYVGWSGLHVPMIVHVPEKFKHLAPKGYVAGKASDRLVGFIDLAPTMLSVASIKPPKWQQGAAFMGPHYAPAPKYSYGFRGRADERPDASRSVTDGRYIYIRNYHPHLPHGQALHYQMQTSTTRVWYEMFKAGKLNDIQAAFWKPRAAEELYDLANDPHETKNLANDPAFRDQLAALRAVHEKHLVTTRDTALLPERLMHQYAVKHQVTPYEVAQKHYECERLVKKHARLQLLDQKTAGQQVKAMQGKPVPQREHWTKTYLLSQSNDVIRKHMDYIVSLSGRDSTSYELIARAHPDEKRREGALAALVKQADASQNGLYTCIDALNALTRLRPLPVDIRNALAAQPDNVPNCPGFAKSYIPRLRESLGLKEAKKKSAKAKKRKNVLFIIADDLNCDIGCYGHPTASTPFIDKLAKQSLLFTQAYSQNPRCNPSRTSFLTGLYPTRSGVQSNTAPHFRKKHPNIVTLPQLFKNNGYFTARVGKLYHYGVPSQIGTNGEDDPASWHQVANPRGIDREVHDRIHSLQKGRFGGTLSWLKLDSDHREHTDAKGADAAIEFLDKNNPNKTDRPFFLAVGFYRPHTPYVAPPGFFDLHPLENIQPYIMPKHDRDDIPHAALADRPKQLGLTMEQRKEIIQAYYASISLMDAQVGRVMHHLEKLKLMDDTIVVFTSDHGYHLGAHGLWQKGDLFEGSCRVPLLVRAPGVTQAGWKTKSLVEMIDFYPTLADLCGLKKPDHLQGVSQVPVLKDPRHSVRKSALTMSPSAAKRRPQTPRGKRVMGYTIRTKDYRYTEWNGGEEGKELYRYSDDPHEITNLSGKQEFQAVEKAMRQQLRQRVGQAQDAEGHPKKLSANDYTSRQIRGWKVYIEKSLNEHKRLPEAVRLLDAKLAGVEKMIRPEILPQLRAVPIWLNKDIRTGACYHPNPTWLKNNDRMPEKVRSIELQNINHFIDWSKSQPMMILHELAHAYHHRVHGFQHAGITKAYQKAKASGKYDRVKHVSGQMKRHYGLSNEKEYFAECTEAYFGKNDFYPFNRAELKQFDPQGYAMVENVWKITSN